MNITYKYTVEEVDTAAKCMVVKYEAEGHETMLVSMRLPNVGEELDAVVKEYSPVVLWRQRAADVYAPEVGASSTLEEAEDTQQVDEPPMSNVEILDV